MTLSSKQSQFNNNVELFQQFMQGDASTVILTAGGELKSLLKIQDEYAAATEGQPISALKFMSEAQRADYLAGSCTINVSAALQEAFDTGQPIFFPAGEGLAADSIASSGQQITGPGKIKTLKESGIPTSVPASVAVKDESGKTRAIYVEAAWDLQDMLTIRSLGFSTVIHYGNWDNGKAGEAVGTWAQFINNAKTAGLVVVMNTEWAGATPATVTAIGDAVGSPVVSYLMYDEPAARGIDRATQETKLAAYRAVTNKPLGLTDYAQAGFFVDDLASTYDYCFLDIYLDFSINTFDLAKRAALHAFGEITVKIPSAKIIPTLGLFHVSLLTMAERLRFAREFAKLSQDGSYAAFAWDAYGNASILANTRNNAQYRQCALDVYHASVSGARYTAEVYAWGTEGGNPVPLGDIVRVWKKDYSTPGVQPFSVTNVGSQVDARQSTFSKQAISYPGVGGFLATGIASMGHVYFRGYAGNSETAATMDFNLIGSQDDWYGADTYATALNVPNYNVSGFVISAPVTPRIAIGLRMTYSTAPATHPWRFLSGMIVNSNWTST